ncbi:MAG: DUF1874 domain-containing protein [Chloroflexi bacterium]|nr:MAG: DUF1874 domain-containing protein [Chloroflexota bacterium]
MTLYLLNSLVLTDYGLWRFSPLSEQEARQRASGGFVSAVGHEGTARLLSEVLGVQVPVAHNRVQLKPGDAAIVLQLLERLPEGAVLDTETLRTIPRELSLLERQE